tara:strand:+ start:26565 stop:28691 length:2127 start_codon:yes stop_codon:yes gene_type:complete
MKKFSQFKSVRCVQPATEPINALELIEIIRSDVHKATCEAIRVAPDKDCRSKIKAKLPVVTASGRFSKREAAGFIQHSGILIADVDLEDNPQLIEEVQMYRIVTQLCEDSNTHLLFVSPSGGLKVGVKVDAVDSRTHKSSFMSVRSWFNDTYGLVIDNACSDVSRLCFLSYDPKAYYNANSKVIKTIEIKKDDRPYWEPQKSIQSKEGLTPGDDFSKKTDPSDMLKANGWKTQNGKQWTRPGKSSGVSGTLGVTANNQFWCWSSSAMPLEANKSYNPFALYAAFYHAGKYQEAAIKLAADGYGQPLDAKLPSAAVATIEALIVNEMKKDKDSWKPIKAEIDKAKSKIKPKDPNSENQFLEALRNIAASTEENIKAMKKRAQEAVFILPEIAMIGDCTILNAGPNIGKTLLTLWLLTKRDKKKTKHLEIFYINADDSFNGGIEKMEILKDEGIITLIPNQNGFDSGNLSKIIKAAIDEDVCGRMVIILDTLKKFVSTMDKGDARIFNIMVRTFTQAGGTLIALAHINKKKDSDGKSIGEGVGDFQSDFDCAYIIESDKSNSGSSTRTVVFENMKLRGPNSMKVILEYDSSEKKSWHKRFQSVVQIETWKAKENEAKKKENEAKKRLENQLKIDQPIIDYIAEVLAEGPQSSTSISRNNLDIPASGSTRQRMKVLDRYVGKHWGKSKQQSGMWKNQFPFSYYLLKKGETQ